MVNRSAAAEFIVVFGSLGRILGSQRETNDHLSWLIGVEERFQLIDRPESRHFTPAHTQLPGLAFVFSAPFPVINLTRLSPFPKSHLLSTSSLSNTTDRLRDLEKKTGQSKVYFFFAIVSVFSFLIYGLGGMKLVADICGFCYPAYMSFKSIESSDTTDDDVQSVQWLTYWVVFALFSIVENFMSFLVSWIPFYFAIKVSFFLWLYHPKFMGAGLVYKQIVK